MKIQTDTITGDMERRGVRPGAATEPGTSPTTPELFLATELYYPEDRSTGYFLTCIAEGLAHLRTVTVLCAQPTYDARGQRAPKKEFRNGVTIHRCWATTFSKDHIVLRLSNLVTISLSVFFKACKTIRPGTTVLVVSNPPTLPFLMLAASRLRRAKCVLLIHDVYPDVLTAVGAIRSDSPICLLMHAAYRWLYRRMHGIIVLGRDMAHLVRNRIQPRQIPIHVIPHWADTHAITPADPLHNELLKNLGLVHKFVVQYSGNMGRTHDIQSIITAARLLSDTPEVHFLLIGSGAQRARISRAVRDQHLENVTLLPYQRRSNLPVTLNACNVALVSLRAGMAGVSVPSRMYNIFAAGKPTLAMVPEASELGLLIRQEGIGWTVPPEQPSKLADTIRQILRNRDCLQVVGKRARALAERDYSLEQSLTAYDDALR
jgi:glycosyltransferase involved in cell wall biosynthesis